jgi:hypothetical protein
MVMAETKWEIISTTIKAKQLFALSWWQVPKHAR